ncbi:MAG: VWA domain-containing protein [Kineosporiaceae bacterium]
MSRHDSPSGATPAGATGAAAGAATTRPRRRVPVAAGLVTVGLLAVAGAAGQAWVDERTSGTSETCEGAPPRTVVVAADPTIAEPLREATADLGRAPLEVGGCVSVVVTAQDPLRTASQLSTLPPEQLPDLWVPDSSTWLDRVAPNAAGADVPLVAVGSLASSPLVVAANTATVAELGWQETSPTWAEVLTSGRPVALPDRAGSAAGVSALVALRQSVLAAADPPEQGPVAVQTALTAVANAIDAADVTSLDQGFEAAAAGGVAGPVVPTSEQQWFLRTRGAEVPSTVAVRPRDGSVVLDYPLIRVDRQQAGQHLEAVEGIIRVLEDDGRRQARAWGFSEPVVLPGEEPSTAAAPVASPAPSGSGAPAPEASVPGALPSLAAPETAPLLPPPTAEQIDTLLADLERLSRPARALLVVDASLSMQAPTGSGTRATLARDAVKTSVALFPDSATVGLWFFAVGMGPAGQDHLEVVPVRPMTEDAGGVSQRAAILAGTDTLVDRLTPGGTGLNDTVLAAVRSVREGYDPEASNVVVVVTDGRNDADGISQEDLVATLAAENDPQRPVRVIVVGLAQDSDPAALRAMADATGGQAYVAEQPEDFQTVLFDALRRRT